MPLTPRQRAALPALLWLHSDDIDDRRSGRSYVLALSYVAHALDGRWVEVVDHVRSAHSRLVEDIRAILDEQGAVFESTGFPSRFRITIMSDKLRRFIYDTLHEADPLPSAEPEAGPPPVSAWRRLLEED